MTPEVINTAVILNIADYIIIGVVLLSVVISLFRGFIREVFSLLSWGSAIFLAIFFCSKLAELFATKIHSPAVRLLVSFALIFVVTLIIGALLSHLFVSVAHKTGLSGTDRFLGAVFGLLRGALVVALLIMVGQLTKVTEHDAWKNSILIPHFKVVANEIKEWAPQVLNWGDKSPKKLSENEDQISKERS